jgi:hypothetical protein
MADKQRKKNDHALLMVLACGATVEAAAKQVNLSDRTIYRRLKDPVFKRQLAQVRADMVQRTAGTLTAAAAECVRTLVTLLNPQEPGPVRLAAARAVLELGIKFREAADIEQRLIDLEAQVAALNQGPNLHSIPDDGESTAVPGEPATESTTVPVEPAAELAGVS